MTVRKQSLPCDTKCANIEVVRKGKVQMTHVYMGSPSELIVFSEIPIPTQ